MTGPEHYSLAETILTASTAYDDSKVKALMYAEAQVHATLALAAATAMAAADRDGLPGVDFDAWDAVCGVRP